MRKIIRFDDINSNTNFDKLHDIYEIIKTFDSDIEIMFGVSLLSFDLTKTYMQETNRKEIDKERVFPPIFTALSDFRAFYKPDYIFDWEPILTRFRRGNFILASHGLIHVDHRLLTREVQEFDILISCSILKSQFFIPPYNKYDKHTEAICDENKIELIKFEDGWRHACANKFCDSDHGIFNYYLHPFDMTVDQFERWIRNL